MVIYQVEAGRTHSTHGRFAERMRFISLGSSTIFPAALKAALFVVAFLHFPVPGNAQQGPFAGLSGAWSGGGYLTLASGQRERLTWTKMARGSSRACAAQATVTDSMSIATLLPKAER
jgi:hypothetical protein